MMFGLNFRCPTWRKQIFNFYSSGLCCWLVKIVNLSLKFISREFFITIGSIMEAAAANPLYDPLELTLRTEGLIIKGNKRKYLRFGTTPDYGTGIATGYVVGCNLRCLFCWSHETRDDLDLVQDYYSPEDVFEILSDIASMHPRIDKIRISDGEATLGFNHLLELLELTEKSHLKLFVVETNGILLGNHEEYARELSKFKKVFVRVSLKAGSPEAFSRKTGATPESFFLPLQAIRNLRKYQVNFGVSAMSADPRFMDPLERISLISYLGQIDPKIVLKLEEEFIILFPTARKRLEKAGWNVNNYQLPFYLKGPWKKYLQMSYRHVNSLEKQKLSLRFTLKNFIQLRHGI